MIQWLVACALAATPVDGVSGQAPEAPCDGEVISLFAYACPAAPDDGALHLNRVLAEVNKNNPTLLRQPYVMDALRARREQAGIWDNPRLEASLEDAFGGGEFRGLDGAEINVDLMQKFEVNGRRGHRQRALDQAFSVAEFAGERARLTVLARAATAYVEILGYQEHIEHSQAAKVLVERFAKAARRNVEVGAGSKVDAIRADTANSRALVDLRVAEQRLAYWRARLANLGASTVAKKTRALGELDRLPKQLPSLAVLMQRIDGAPALRGIEAERLGMTARADAAGAAAIPDIIVGAGMRYHRAVRAFSAQVSLGLELPTFDRNQGERAAVAAELYALEAAAEGVRAEVRTQLSERYADLAAAHIEAQQVHDIILPAAQNAYELLVAGYERGRYSLLEVLDGQRNLYEAIEAHHLVQVRFHLAVIRIEEVLGAPFARLNAPVEERT